MRKRLLTSSIIIVALALVSAGVYTYAKSSETAHTNDYTSSQTQYAPPTREELLKLVNEERAENGVAALVVDERLNKSAQRKADDMVKYDYFGHKNHDGTQGYEYIYEETDHKLCKIGGENLTDNVTQEDNTSGQAIYSWEQSKPHHDAMISKKYTLTGFGINGTKIVQHFCQQ